MRVWFALALSYLSLSVSAADFQVPPLTGPVVDQADLLSPSTRAKVDSFLRRLRDSGGTQLQVLTVNDLGGLTIEQASIQVSDQWKLGSAKEDNGVLLMVAKSERKVRIEVGQGREGVLPDVVASRIIREVITPRFRQGSMDSGVVEGVIAIVQRTDPEFLKSSGQKSTAQGDGRVSGRTVELILLLLFFTVIILPPLFGRRRFRHGGYFPNDFGGGGGWSGGGGSSWGGGGGGFSGGGASGDW